MMQIGLPIYIHGSINIYIYIYIYIHNKKEAPISVRIFRYFNDTKVCDYIDGPYLERIK
jgi:hypothetical protein